MSYHETQYPDLLGGVSQQSPTERAPNALSEQVNMVSDPVLGLRRRPPFEFLTRLSRESGSPATSSDQTFLRSRLRGREVIIMITRTTGEVAAFDAEEGSSIGVSMNPGTADYLLADSAGAYKITSLRDTLYVVNTEVSPTEEDVSTTDLDPVDYGYIYVVRGAFSTKYSVTLRNLDNEEVITGSYETPDGTGATDADLTAPGYIASEVHNALRADADTKGYTWLNTFGGAPTPERNTQILVFTAPVEIRTEQDASLIRSSQAGTIRAASELPPNLPRTMDSFRMAVSSGGTKEYYRYDAGTSSWLESSSFDAIQRLENLGVTISFNPAGSFTVVDNLTSRPRPAGDQESNPALRLVEGVTGVGSFRGRLILLAGDFVCMSAANDTRGWYRSTLVDLLDNDPIEIAESATKASPYTYATGFAGGLVLTASTHQAYIPSTVALTPSTATLSTLSEYSQRDDVPPELIGSALLLPFNRNDSAEADGLYHAAFRDSEQPVLIANDMSQAVPNYLGRIRHMTLSTSAGMLALSDFTNRLVVFQFTSEETDSALAAWHSWTLPPTSTIRDLYFIGGSLYAVVGVTRETTEPDVEYILVRAEVSNGLEPVHFLDFSFQDALTDELAPTIPTDYPKDLFSPDIDYKWFALDGDFAELGGDADFDTLAFADDISKTGTFWYGLPYESSASPSPPIIRDRSEYALRRERVNLVKFRAHLENTGTLQADVFDRVHTFTVPDLSPVGLYMPEGVGSGALSGDGYVTIPCRTDAQYTQLTLRTDDFYDMNIKAVEYGFKVQPKHRRA